MRSSWYAYGVDSFLSHPYRILLAGTAVLLCIGTIVIVGKNNTAHENTQGTWGDSGLLTNPFGYGEQAEPSSTEERAARILQEQLERAGTYSYTQPSPATSESGAEEFDFAAFLEALSNPQQKESVSTGGADTSTLLKNLYTFIPRGLIAVETPPARTNLQEELFAYGNRFGSSVRAFEDAHMNGIQILRDQAEDRGNPEKAAAAVRYARDLEALGRELEEMSGIPGIASSFHHALAKSYTDAGKKLALIPRARTDEEVIASVETYNRSMDVFTGHYVALVQFFVAQGVSFSPGDPGSIFSFSAPVSLGGF